MSRLLTTLKSHDVTLWLKLEEQKLLPQFYAFRWLTLLLSQEFDLPGVTSPVRVCSTSCLQLVCLRADVQRLWDSLLAWENKLDFLLQVCCAMLM